MNHTIPQHVAIIMDGNGRWAQNRGLKRFEGHRAGVASIKHAIRFCLKAQIPVLSLFAFSRENWTRPEEEVTFLMQLFFDTLEYEIQDMHDNQVRLQFCGSRENLPEPLCILMESAEKLTQNNDALVLNLALNYGGRWDLVQAMRRMTDDIAQGKLLPVQIHEKTINSYLMTSHLPEPDLLIRTSGEWRLSNFFLWQLAYTELYFTKTLWPDFNDAAFEKALKSFRERERRYGKTSEQVREELVLE